MRPLSNWRLTVIKVAEEVAVWEFQGGREYGEKGQRPVAPQTEQRKRLVKTGAGPGTILAGITRKTAQRKIGLPAVLPLCETQVLGKTFFNQLGFEVIALAPEEKHFRRRQNLAQAEFCAPVYLAHGQVAQLFDLGVEAIFFPLFLGGPELPPDPELPAYYCCYTSYLPLILRHSPAGKQAKIISPLVDFRWPFRRIFASLESQLEKIARIRPAQVRLSWEEAWKQWKAEKVKLRAEGQRVLASLRPGEWAVVFFWPTL